MDPLSSDALRPYVTLKNHAKNVLFVYFTILSKPKVYNEGYNLRSTYTCKIQFYLFLRANLRCVHISCK